MVELDPALPAGTAATHSFRERRGALAGAAPVFPQLGVQNQHTPPIPSPLRPGSQDCREITWQEETGAMASWRS